RFVTTAEAHEPVYAYGLLLAFLARSPHSGDEIIDLHPLAEIRIDESRLHQPITADYEGRGNRQYPAVIAVKLREVEIRQQLLDFGSQPDSEIERERITIVQIGQHRERRAGFGFESLRIFLCLRHDRNDLPA